MTMEKNGLAKLVEECGELIQVAAKKMAFMHTDKHPDGNGSLKNRMEEEAGDVLAAIIFVKENFGLSEANIELRTGEKLAKFRAWHADPNA